MRFAEAAFAVNEQRVISPAGVFRDLFRGGVSVVVRFTDDEVFKGVFAVVD